MAKGFWVILNVGNVDKSVEFYKGLGLKAARESGDGMEWGTVTTSLSDAGIVLWPKSALGPGQAPDTMAWLSGELGKGVLIGLGVPNARKTWERAQASHATIDTPLREQEWGGHEFNVVDPDGYVLNVTDKFPGMTKPARKKVTATTKKAKAKAKTVVRKAKKAAATRRR
jgi:catechol 2,3-dioxygenase-like lactoylglutathione lyase family enzyme